MARRMSSATEITRSLVEALDEPALIVRGTKIVHSNRAARDLFGGAIEGKDVRLAIRHPEALARILPGEAVDLAIDGIGEFRRPWTLSVRKLGSDLVLVRLVDRSATVAAEKMRVDFVANASHELRTPLSAIRGYAETLADDPDLDGQTRMTFGQIIDGEARRMLRIVEDLMSLSRIEADRFVAPSDEVSLAELVALAAANVRELAAENGCRIDLDLDPNVPPIRGDQAQLSQMFDNLLSNAVRHGCGSAGCTVTVRMKRQGESIELTVRDEGEGIAAEHLARLTERFYRVDPARSRDRGGTGLGLAIVKHIVERHRGRLTITSAVGEGTQVSVSLPLNR